MSLLKLNGKEKEGGEKVQGKGGEFHWMSRILSMM